MSKNKSRTFNLAFNRTELNKFLRKCKKEALFFYTIGVGFSEGHVLLSDNTQVQEFMKSEFLGLHNIWSNYGRPIERDIPSEALKSYSEDCNIEAQYTDFVYQGLKERFNKKQYRIFKTQKGNFLIDEKFLNLIDRTQSNDIKYYTTEALTNLIIKTGDGELIAIILGIKTTDKEREIYNQIQSWELKGGL